MGMILPRRPITPRIHGTSEATERGSVKRMISCTEAIGRAYSSEPIEKTTSCWEVMSDMSFTQIGQTPAGLSRLTVGLTSDDRGGAEGMSCLQLPARWEAHDETRAATVERRFQGDVALVARGARLDDGQAEAGGARTIAVSAEEAFEDLVVQLGWDARPVILHREHDVPVLALHAGLHRRARVGVSQRVLHQVEHEA